MNASSRCPHCGRPATPISIQMVGCCTLCLRRPTEHRQSNPIRRAIHPVPFGDAYPDEDALRLAGRTDLIGV